MTAEVLKMLAEMNKKIESISQNDGGSVRKQASPEFVPGDQFGDRVNQVHKENAAGGSELSFLTRDDNQNKSEII